MPTKAYAQLEHEKADEGSNWDALHAIMVISPRSSRRDVQAFLVSFAELEFSKSKQLATILPPFFV